MGEVKVRKSVVLFLSILFLMSVFFVGFASANIFSDLWGRFTGKVIEAPIGSINEGYICSNLPSDSQSYVSICRDSGFEGVCFDKLSGGFQGCTDSKGFKCTFDNVNSEKNLLCMASSVNGEVEVIPGSEVGGACVSGCLFEGDCFSLGEEKGEEYCSKNGQFMPLILEGEKCSASYECSTDYCSRGTCLEPSLFRRLFGLF